MSPEAMCNCTCVTVVLFVCTGNLCRSPSAALLLDQHVVKNHVSNVTVRSAGTQGASFGPPDQLVKEAAAFGIDLSGHVPQKINPGMIAEADLVVGLSRAHVREIVLADTSSFPKTFTLREIVRRAIDQGPRPVEESLRGWLATLHEGRKHGDLIGDSRDDDIDDPMGGSPDDYRLMLQDVSTLTGTLGRLAWP